MNTLTNQEAFDRVCEHLANQKTRSMISSDGNVDSCAYRNKLGHMCAIGIFIPNELYHERLEGVVARSLFIDGVLPMFGVDQVHFIERLQSAHDFSTSLSSLQSELQDIAEYYELDPSAISLITEFS